VARPAERRTTSPVTLQQHAPSRPAASPNPTRAPPAGGERAAAPVRQYPRRPPGGARGARAAGRVRPRRRAVAMGEVTVQLLGSGDAFGSGGRLQACISVRAVGAHVLLDCGASSLVALK